MTAVVSNLSYSERQFGYVDELFGIAVPPEGREVAKFPLRTAGAGTPEPLPHYLFRKDHIKVAQLWMAGIRKNILLTGPTGSGKSSFIEQIANRVGWEVICVSCSGSLEAQQLIGRITLNPEGTGWTDGPVITAMKSGSILLLEEINLLHPDELGGLNKVFDGGSYRIIDTGERVLPHPDFRIAGTGNALSGDNAADYRGTKRLNLALADRFQLGIEVDYISAPEETLLVLRAAPAVESVVVSIMIHLANGIRKSFLAGDLSVTMSTRILLSWAEVLSAKARGAKRQATELLAALEIVFLYRVGKQDKQSIVTSLAGLLQRNPV